MNDQVVNYIIIPFMIFMARVCDVSIGTVRIILISRGNKMVAPLLGFIEVLIWISAISQVMKNMSNIVCYLAYGAGFATGNYVGMLIESKLAMGLQMVRVISRARLQLLPGALRSEGYGVTTVEGRGAAGKVNVIFSTIPRKEVVKYVKIVDALDPEAFITVEDVRSSKAGYFSNISRKNVQLLKDIFKKK